MVKGLPAVAVCEMLEAPPAESIDNGPVVSRAIPAVPASIATPPAVAEA